ncbi:T9SS type A sorting domain-containing protein [Rhodocytophaga rosea]|uniref:T9SS type A sorting domain-containing protein n=1 Tax=Rhodocytophaga rosea TaxID=2704465 RepID=A0A6C0GJM1_9BACT|nr:CUB domain-containing protein [Rhodocytophaga rosea]QHT68236.1 T9SS type A sorting domain-containing protein [Rhodocytophaga rosea]
MTQTSDGGYLLGGTSESGISGDKTTLSTSYSTSYSSHWIVKITSTGIKQWDLSAGYAVIYNEGVNVIKDNDGGYLLLSEATDDHYNRYSQLFKITGSGQIQWSRTFKANPVSGNGLFHYSVLRSGFQTNDGGFILAGVTDAEAGKDVSQPSKGNHDFWVVKTTRQIQPGEIVMSSGSTGVNAGTTYYDPGFAANYQNNLNLTQTLSPRVGYKLRLTFTSFQLENNYDKLYIYDGTSTASPLIGVYTGSTSPGIITSSTGSLTLRFVSDGSINYPGWAASVSYVATGARLAAVEEKAPEETLLKLEAFPNPFREKITFNFTAQQTGPVSLRIYDSKGIEATNVFAGEMQAGGTNSVEWQPNGQQEGVYIVRLATPGKVITNKVVLVK